MAMCSSDSRILITTYCPSIDAFTLQ